ncbi:MAG: 1,6-anhydro-N-acetylmuramyl-L-alanine amidase AmpD [Candidatus Ruthia sp.]|nr:1,6-anhydro-N-acetylmuramyl-L-alanine amidase AmpD [Candidatus Ruthturnera sp.]MBT4123528.1 1,6-anhydro-N-acetylmuramyl-L-alanine amidase AmpD [Candidatus Ruthturnera sp.]MBT4668008.1 1,6-anhydro-N-acetylmuramyl-L-alanine amidase AmpD [Candidatus Ruthturnera sp.]MBT6921964.1 1,6-anhydro-N-acetylmuramyl-L-alanine amidase AmpD [Candidatus Ruthturnera sp.]
MINNHLLSLAKQSPSDNKNERPDNEISLVVIHNISLPPGEFNNDYIEQFFTNQLDFNKHAYFQNIKEMQVSAHLLIKRDGSSIQFVPFDQRAWHAGESSFKDQNNCNDYSIGIELEGSDNLAYEAVQYQSLKIILNLLKAHYPIEAVVGHSDIAPGRKTDPGKAFNWDEIQD